MVSVLPAGLEVALRDAVGSQIRGAAPLGGGMVARAAFVQTSDGPLFVKWKDDPPARFFECEADGLARLRASGAVRVPAVVAWQDVTEPDAVPFLALEYVEQRPPRDGREAETRACALGEQLGALHRLWSPFGAFGLDIDNYLGSQPQINTPAPSWAAFYVERRLVPQIERARLLGRVPAHRERLLGRVIERSGDILVGLRSEPCLIHGDLWAGNLLHDRSEPVLVDPAVHYAEREVEIAYMQLFDGFPEPVFAAYDAAYPLQPGYPQRRPFHQLYPLLIHLNHFGESSYGSAVDAACTSCLSI